MNVTEIANKPRPNSVAEVSNLQKLATPFGHYLHALTMTCIHSVQFGQAQIHKTSQMLVHVVAKQSCKVLQGKKCDPALA